MALSAHVLVVANVTGTSPELLAALAERAQKGPIVATLLMPARGPGLGGREAVRERLEATLAAWREAGLDVDGLVGDADPMAAVAETWDPRRHDEVIVSTLPAHDSKWIGIDLPHRVERLTGVPVRHVVAAAPAPAHRPGPPPASRRSRLGPLAVLGWGRRRQNQ